MTPRLATNLTLAVLAPASLVVAGMSDPGDVWVAGAKVFALFAFVLAGVVGAVRVGVALLLGVRGLLVWPAHAYDRCRRRRWRSTGRCDGCGYDLRASAGRCPECGVAIGFGPPLNRRAPRHP